MSMPILILGASGSGKTTSIEELPANETFLISVKRKELPFRGANKNYIEINDKTSPNGNRLISDSYKDIFNAIIKIDKELTQYKNIVLDDTQYLIVNHFMKYFNKTDTYKLFNEIALNFWKLLELISNLREDLFIFLLHHIEINDHGIIVPKSFGKLLNEKIDIAGNFTIVLLAQREGINNFFYTQNDGSSPAKSPKGMFNDIKIDNNLKFIKKTIINYYKGV